MTNIAYIRGIDQKADIPAQVAPEAVYDPRQMSKGEFKLALLQDQLRILGQYYGNTEQLQAANQLRDYLAAGFHNLPTAMVGSSIPAVNKAVKAAKKLNQPAGKILIRENKTAGLTDGALAGLTGQAKIGDVLIPYEDCDQFIEYAPDNPYDPYGSQSPANYLPGYAECKKTEQYIALLNQKLAPSSHHLLYEYTTGQGDPATVAAKRVLQRNAVSGIARISGLDRDSLRGWMRNGVMRNNMAGSLPPYQPEDTYYLLKTGVASGLGALPAAAITVKALAELIALIVGAITATVALVSSIRPADRQLLENMAANIGTPTFGPEKGDFFSGGGPGGGGPGSGSGSSGSGGSGGGLFTGDNSIIIPAAAAAAVLLLTSK
jgi:hypothetical protein